MVTPIRLLVAAGLAVALMSVSDARAESPWSDAFTDGQTSFGLRYQHEWVSQDGNPEDATAHTLRTRLGYTTAASLPLQATVEHEHVTRLGSGRFNDTVNGRTASPVVADPDSTEINRAWINLAFAPGTSARFGRHRIKYDSDRFVGNVGWRQNGLTFDGLRLTVTAIPGLEAEYAFISRVNRIFGKDSAMGTFDTRNHFIHLDYPVSALGRLVGYGYLLNFEDAPALSSRTFGLRLAGAFDAGSSFTFLYTLEAARQSDHADNPNTFDLGYWVVEPGLRFGDVTLKLGYESLRGDGTVAFQTPLATLHAFQGFANKFLTTPPDGIDDYYATLLNAPKGPGLLTGTRFAGVYRRFDTAVGGETYGSELDLVTARKFAEKFNALLKVARYQAKAHGSDTTKVWLSLGYTH